MTAPVRVDAITLPDARRVALARGAVRFGARIPAPGVTLYFPDAAVHAVPQATGPLSWSCRFADIRHRFLHESPND